MGYRTRRFIISFLFFIFMLLLVKQDPAWSQTLNHWAEEQVVEWLNRKLLPNEEEKDFAYNEHLTRAEFVALINHIFAFQGQADLAFRDITSSAWYAGEFAKAVKAGYLQGYADGTMKPFSYITRQEAAVILAKLFHLSPASENNLAVFKDLNDIPPWSKVYLSALVAEGCLSGYEDQTLRPDKYITKAEAMVLLAKTAGIFFNEPTVYGSEKEKTIIPGNVTISSPGFVLNNLEIGGNLYIFQEDNREPIVLNNVTVRGRTLLRGDGTLQLKVEGDSQLNLIILGSVLRVQGDHKAFSLLTVREAPKNARLQLNGSFQKLSIETGELVLSLSSGTVTQLELAPKALGTLIELDRSARIELLNALAPAYINGEGAISKTAIRAGGVVIGSSVRQADQAFSGTGGKKDKDKNLASPLIRVEEIILSPDSLRLEVGQMARLTASIKPVTATNKNVSWLSSDPQVVTVDRQGLATALSPGTAIITVVTEDGAKSATCLIEVREPLDQLAELLQKINSAEHPTDLQKVLEANAALLGLSLEDYLKLDETTKLLVLQGLQENKPGSGYSVESLRAAFQEVVELEMTIQAFLVTVNNAREVTDLQDLSWLEKIIASLEKVNYYFIRGGKGLPALKNDLVNIRLKFSLLEDSERQAALQQLLAARPLGGYRELSEVSDQCALALSEVLKELEVANQHQLFRVLSFNEVKTIKLSADLYLAQPVLINRPVTILGNNHLIYLDKDMEGSPTSFVLQVRDTDGVYLQDLKLLGGEGALLLSGSRLVLTGRIELSANGYGGIKLERTGEKAASLDISQAEIIKIGESYGLPVIWLEEQEAGSIIGGQLKKLLVRNEIHYYTAAVRSPVTTIKVKTDNNIILSIDNEKRTLVRASGYVPIRDIKRVLESTDWSKQKYTFWPEEGSKPLADDVSPGNRSKLVVTAEDGREATYTIFVG